MVSRSERMKNVQQTSYFRGFIKFTKKDTGERSTGKDIFFTC